MQFPVVFDIIIGLFFIYLILSLLASEIQELIATLLQWRAEHLKQSIETLLAGGSEAGMTQSQSMYGEMYGEIHGAMPGDTYENAAAGVADPHVVNANLVASASDLANTIYDNPIISTLNQEAKGLFAEQFRKLFQKIYHLGQSLLNRKGNVPQVFGNRNSGPSYIPSEAFAEALLSSLRIPDIIQIVSARRLEKFAIATHRDIAQMFQPIVGESPEVVKVLRQLKTRFDEIVVDYRSRKVGLPESLDRMALSMDRYAMFLRSRLTNTEAIDRLTLYRQEVFGASGTSANYEVILANLVPSVAEVLDGIRSKQVIYGELREALDQLSDPNDPTRKSLEAAITKMPAPVRESLLILARKARTKATSIRDEFTEFQTQVETWFDRSQERASGVYKRNARGVAILIGLAIAVGGNADTLHIVNNLAGNSVLRDSVSSYATDAIQRTAADAQTMPQFEAIRTNIDPALKELTIPIGWDQYQLSKQFPQENVSGFAQWFWIRVKVVFGWMITAIAISMGSSFWFNILNKIVNLRNSGKS